jgi:hypothetical protein
VTGFLAVFGFWTFMILLLFRRRWSSPVPPAELTELRERVRQLEHQLGAVQGQLHELADGHDYTLKLLKESPKSEV